MTSKKGLSRRRFLRSTAVATGAAGAAQLVGATSTTAQSSRPGRTKPGPVPHMPLQLPFAHGVASGDPLEDAVIIWTRVTPSAEAVPGSKKGSPTRVRWEVAEDMEFKKVVKDGDATTSPDSDHTVKVDVRGLDADKVYYYRFTIAGGDFNGRVSQVGRTKTAPAKNAKVDQQRWAIASCANWESGFFSAYRDVAERGWDGDIDLMVFLGDYIYEYPQYQYAGFGPVRLHEPAHEIVNLQDYRTRYGRYRTDVNLRNAHASMPWIVTWDDHEVADNNWREGAYNHQPNEGDFFARRDAAMQAYYEWMPMRESDVNGKGPIYRSFTFGDLVELSIMDLRTYRDIEYTEDANAIANYEKRSMLGSDQYKWLMDTIEASNTKWNALGNSVMFSPLHLGALYNNEETKPVAEVLSSGNIPVVNLPLQEIPLNGDQWDGYDFERKTLISDFDRMNKTPLFLTGDIHTEWAHTVRNASGKPIGCEVVCASISAPNVAESLNVQPGNPLFRTARKYLHAANPQLRHLALDTHGYAVVTIKPEDVKMEWMRVDNVLAPLSRVRSKVAITWKKGVGYTS